MFFTGRRHTIHKKWNNECVPRYTVRQLNFVCRYPYLAYISKVRQGYFKEIIKKNIFLLSKFFFIVQDVGDVTKVTFINPISVGIIIIINII